MKLSVFIRNNLEEDQIQFVLTDFAMPHMNGLETMIALRQIVPGIPVIMASGFGEEQVMEGTHPELPQVFLGKLLRI